MKLSSDILEPLPDKSLIQQHIHVHVLRLDQMHPLIGGNKYFKLKLNLEEAKKQNQTSILTFGGAYSNHIYATAAAGAIFGFKTIGIIRGEAYHPLNETLAFAQTQGMELHYMDRQTYREKNSPAVIEQLKNKFGHFYLIPEGGTNAWAVKGCKEILSYLPKDFHFDYVCCPCGTGGTLAGLIASLSNQEKALGFSVLKGDFLKDDVKKLLDDYAYLEKIPLDNLSTNWFINTDYHFGGYAKKKAALVDFIQYFQEVNQIPIEWIYSGKMFYGIYDLIKKGFFPPSCNILALHTGGIRF